MPYKYISVAEMISVEKAAEKSGLSYAQMMENAGTNLGIVVECELKSNGGDKTILGLVGKGNNGGDTLIALAYLAAKGYKVVAYIVGQRSNGDPLIERVIALGGEFLFITQIAILKNSIFT